MKRTLIACMFFSLAPQLISQFSEQDVRKRLDLIYSGQLERVLNELPTLEQAYPNDPGVRYLQAIVTTDGEEAVKKFQAIVDQFPQSEWADDALYKVYQYYYSIGLYKTAGQKLEQLKQGYPNSVFVGEASAEPAAGKEVAKSEPQQKTLDKAKEHHDENAGTDIQKPSPGKFAVQAGAFSTMKNARKQADFFETIGSKAVVTPKEVAGRTLYVVSVEGFTDEQEARRFIADLKSKYNIESIIVAR